MPCSPAQSEAVSVGQGALIEQSDIAPRSRARHGKVQDAEPAPEAGLLKAQFGSALAPRVASGFGAWRGRCDAALWLPRPKSLPKVVLCPCLQRNELVRKWALWRGLPNPRQV